MTAIFGAYCSASNAIPQLTQITLTGRNIGSRSSFKIAAQSGGAVRSALVRRSHRA